MEEFNAERARALEHAAHTKYRDEELKNIASVAQALYERCLSVTEMRAKQGNSYALVEWNGNQILRREDYDAVIRRLSEKGFKCEFKEAAGREQYNKIMINWG